MPVNADSFAVHHEVHYINDYPVTLTHLNNKRDVDILLSIEYLIPSTFMPITLIIITSSIPGPAFMNNHFTNKNHNHVLRL